MSADEIDMQFPYIQIHRSVAAKAAMLAARTGVEYFKLRGVLDCWWESMADRRILAKAVSEGGVMLTADQVEQAVSKPCDGKITPADMVAAGFLEPRADRFRARGMSRYIEAENTRLTRKQPGSNRGPTGVRPPSDPPPTLVQPGSDQGPTRQTRDERLETRDERLETKEEEALPLPEKGRLIVWEPPKTEPETWNAVDFWGWAQSRRQKAGFVGEQKLPFDLRKWFSGAMLSLGGKTEVLQEAFLNFGDDPYWQKQKPVTLPFAGFMAQWATFLPRGVHVS